MTRQNGARQVIVTRPDPDAASLASALRHTGFDPVVAPLMTIDLSEGPAPDLSGFQAVAFTSANGVRAFQARGGATEKPAFTVGPASAAACRDAGFAVVHPAAGSVESLADLIREHCRADQGAIYHGAGETLAGDLVALLKEAGLEARRDVLYTARAATHLPEPFARVLRGPDPGFVTLFSPRTARLAAALMADAGLTDAAHRMTALCLSPAVADASAALPWAALRVAEEPTTEALLACLNADD